MPSGYDNTRQIMRFIADGMSINTYLNVMGQCYPAGKVSAERYRELNRHVIQEEMIQDVRFEHETGLTRLDKRRRLVRR